MFRKIKESKAKLNQKLISRDSFEQSLQSYYGILEHCDGYKAKKKLKTFIYVKIKKENNNEKYEDIY